MADLWLSGVFFQALNTPKFVFGRGSASDPAGGAYDAPPGASPYRLGEAYASPSTPSVSRSRCLRRLGCQGDPTQIHGSRSRQAASSKAPSNDLNVLGTA